MIGAMLACGYSVGEKSAPILILRSVAWKAARLEGWPQARSLPPSFETLRASPFAPQDEGRRVPPAPQGAVSAPAHAALTDCGCTLCSRAGKAGITSSMNSRSVAFCISNGMPKLMLIETWSTPACW